MHVGVRGHVHTLLAARPPLRSVGGRREDLLLPLPDGDQLVGVGWFHPDRRRCALVLHGVGGSSESPSVVRTARALFAAGVHVVAPTLRGSGRGLPHARKFYHAGLVDDVAAALGFVAARDDVADFVVVGHSLGGATTLLLAVDPPALPGGNTVRAAVAISAPLDLDGGADWLERWPALPYARAFVKNLVAQATSLKRRVGDALPATYDELAAIRTMRQFDDVVTARVHGFASARSYYQAASPGPRLVDVRVPTLVVHAEDDPIVPWALARPYAEAARAPVVVRTATTGGHVGFVAGLGPSWAHREAIAFLAAA